MLPFFPGYSVAGLIAAEAEFQAAITSAVPAGQTGSFLISVDGSPYVPVSVDPAATTQISSEVSIRQFPTRS